MTYRPRTVLDEIGARDFKPSGMTGAVAASRYVGATASGAPASGTFAVGDHVIDQTGTIYVCTVAGSPGTWVQLKANPTFSTEVTAPDFKPTGLSGATAATRFVGGTASVAPTTGTFAVGDYVITQNGSLYVCTTAGSPGTWTQISGGGGGSSTLAGDTDVSIASPVGGQVLGYSSALSKWVNQNQAGVAATTQTAQLGADVTMTSANTFYDGPSVTLPAGTWLLTGALSFTLTAAADDFSAKLWDGTTVYASGGGARNSGGGSGTESVSLSAVVSPTTSTTYKLSGACGSAGAKIDAAVVTNGAGNNASYLRAIQLSGNPVGQQAPAVHAYNSAAISISNNSETVLTLNSTRYDQGTATAQHSTSTNTSRLTCQQAGLYHIYASIAFDGNATGVRYAYLRLNGSTVIGNVDVPGRSDAYGMIQPEAHWQLSVGDYVEVVVYQNSGGSLNVNAAANYGAEFAMARIDSGPGAVQPNTRVQLDYAASTASELANPVVVSATTWTDICANQTFTVDDPNSVIEIQVDGGCWTTGYASASPNVSTRVMIDSAGTPLTKMLAGEVLHQNTWGIWPVSGQISLTGLSAGSHTVKVQAYASNGSMNFYCRTNSQPNTDFLNIRVLERKQSSSLPSNTPAPAVHCYNSSDTSIANNTMTALTFNTNRYDQGTSSPQHSTASNTSRLTCQQSGVYDITANIDWTVNATGYRQLAIKLNGTTFIADTLYSVVGTVDTRQNVSMQYYLNVGDYVECFVAQTSGGALIVQALANFSPEFMMSRVDSGGQGFVPIPIIKTADYTILNSDCMVVAGATGLTFTLPAASTRAPGMPLVVKNDNYTATTISRAGSDTIDGATTYSLSSAYQSITLVGDGVAVWRII
jgi:hypothetical protein